MYEQRTPLQIVLGVIFARFKADLVERVPEQAGDPPTKTLAGVFVTRVFEKVIDRAEAINHSPEHVVIRNRS